MSTAEKLSPTERLVLAMAIIDGGVVTLTGIDSRNWMTAAHRSAAIRLCTLGYGQYWPDRGYQYAEFTINEVGRKRIKGQS